jgi:hypothetical protein
MYSLMQGYGSAFIMPVDMGKPLMINNDTAFRMYPVPCFSHKYNTAESK